MVHPKSWRGVLGGVTCSITRIVFETAYGSLHQWLLKAFESLPPSQVWSRKDVFTHCFPQCFTPPATEYHSVPYSMCCVVLLLKPVCSWWGKYFTILVCSLLRSISSYILLKPVTLFFKIKYTHGQKIMNVEMGQLKKAEWKPLWHPQLWVCFSVGLFPRWSFHFR